MTITQSIGVLVFTIVMSLLVYNGGRLMEHYAMQKDAVSSNAGHYDTTTAEFRWGPGDVTVIGDPMPDLMAAQPRPVKVKK